eukprot:TRINITY_DN4554_c0_g1_i1.p1 TRINITY_DN4554_c0_g1~~TRINITY_DN4554_c0_g1_i1.p1  ORF type:complete len:527 (+),score=101.08 TRINITY_DN4554_c0_g1_i1:140-1720(+)
MRLLLPLIASLSGLLRIVRAAKEQSPDDLLARINISSPAEQADVLLALYASFSQLPPPVETMTLWVPGGDNASKGCDAMPAAPTDESVVAIVRRGDCAFVTKALNAQQAGAEGLIVVNTEDFSVEMGAGNMTDDALKVNIFVVGLPSTLGGKLMAEAIKEPRSVNMSFSVYHQNIWNVTELLLIGMATALVIAGAFFATADLRRGSPLAPQAHEEVLEVETESAFGFCIMGSIMLVVLFFLMKFMIYFIIFAFCAGGFSCFTTIGSSCLAYACPPLAQRLCKIPGYGSISRAEVLSAVPSLALVVTWVILRNTEYGWIFQDIIGAGFLCSIQRTLRLPNIKVATVLLSIMFFFDIFWVFISPLLFRGKSVMVEVAKGGGTGESVPMLLRLPPFGEEFGSYRMLGFGDIALPGLLISYLRRHDILSERGGCNGYFVPAVVGYFIGLVATICALTIMRMGQPALLYLVPATLGTSHVLGYMRGETLDLWNGTPRPKRESSGDSSGSTGLSEVDYERHEADDAKSPLSP